MTSEGAPSDDPWRQRRALFALVPLFAALLAIALWAPWYSNWDADTHTQFHQIRAVASTGYPGFHNGPAGDLPQLAPRWLTARDGKVWVGYPVGMAYLFALPTRLGGFAGMIRALYLCLAASAALTYALTFRLTRRSAHSVAAAYALILGSSIGGWSTMASPLVPAAAFGLGATYLALLADGDPSTPRRLGRYAGAGMLASWAYSCHMLWFLSAGLIGLWVVARRPSVRSLTGGAAYALGMLPMLALMAWANHEKWGTWSPISFGASDFTSSNSGTVNALPLGAVGSFSTMYKPLAPYALAWLAGLCLLRRSSRAVAAWAALGVCAALVPPSGLREHAAAVARLAWAILFDVSRFDTTVSTYIGSGDEALGMSFIPSVHNLGPVATRSVLQCSPVLALALFGVLAPSPATAEERLRRRVVALSMSGVFLTAMLRAHFEADHARGVPSHNFRYMVPLLPMAFALAFDELRALPLRAWQLALWAATGAGLGGWLLRQVNDEDFFRRKLTLWLPLALAAALVAAVVALRGASERERRWLHPAAALLVALSLGFGTAITVGVDGTFMFKLRRLQDQSTAEVARCVRERRFILLGGWSLDESLALLDRRDIYFMNPGMDDSPRGRANLARLVDEAERPDRPAYIIEDDERGPWSFDWPGFTIKPVPGCPRVRRIARATE